MHVIFFDGECPFCQKWVQRIESWDKKEIFWFASSTGETAKKSLDQSYQSIVLLENQKILHIKSQACFRILWLLGGWKKLLGVLYFLPSFFFDFGYHFIAKHRKKLKKEICERPKRFLP